MDKDTVIITLGGAVVVCAMALVVYLMALRPMMESGGGGERESVYGVAEEFVNALTDGDVQRAWQGMAPAYRQAVSLSRFQAAVTSNPQLASLRGATMGEYVRRGDAATLTGTLDSAGGRLPAELHLARRDDQWYMVEVILAGRPALPSAAGD